jgi:copper chaperone CopZ
MTYEVRMKISNIKCGGCYNRILREVNALDVKHADLDLATNIATITLEDDLDVYKEIMVRIENAGYPVRLIAIDEE